MWSPWEAKAKGYGSNTKDKSKWKIKVKSTLTWITSNNSGQLDLQPLDMFSDFKRQWLLFLKCWLSF